MRLCFHVLNYRRNDEKKEITFAHQSVFESLRKVNQQGQDFWSARELSKVLGYSEFRHFIPVISKAREACENSGQELIDHFEDMLDMVVIGSGAQREVQDVRLGSTELAANLFRATQTEDKLKRDKVKNKHVANQTHYEVGQKVRKTIIEIGGTMPEHLPTEESIKKIERKKLKKIS